MTEDWSINVKKYVPNADDAAIAGIVRYCGIALQKVDSSLVAFSDKSETDRVRENFLRKKLGLIDADSELDKSIAAVGERMKDERGKNRVTVYYLLAELYGKLALFHKNSAAGVAAVEAGDGLGAAAALGAAGLAGAAGLGAAGVAGAAAGAARPAEYASTATAARFGAVDEAEKAGSGLMRWLPWLLVTLALLALLWYLFMRRPVETAAVPAAPEVTAPVTAALDNVAVAAPAPVIPVGAGVTSEMRDGKPAVIVYFDTAKADVAPAFGPAAATLKTYLDANSGSKLSVSGFNDKTGNVAFNAELSKHRAQAVQTALEAANIPAASIELAKPADATDASTTNAQARRVEVVIK